MALKLITPAAQPPIDLAYVKAHLRVVDDDHDDLLTALIKAATAYSESFMKRALVLQTWELTLDAFPTSEIQLPLSPLREIVSIKYDDGAGSEQTIDAADYQVDNVSEPGWVLPLSSWPSTIEGVNAVRIRFTAGHQDPDASPAEVVPEDIKVALALRVQADYDGGDIAEKLRSTAEILLRQHRLHLSMA